MGEKAIEMSVGMSEITQKRSVAPPLPSIGPSLPLSERIKASIKRLSSGYLIKRK